MTMIQKFKDFWTKLFKDAVQQQLAIIMPVARQAIQDIASDPSLLTSDDKRNAAFAKIVAVLAVQEYIFAKRMINLAIEIAVVEFAGVE
jgi:hypothetical protein